MAKRHKNEEEGNRNQMCKSSFGGRQDGEMRGGRRRVMSMALAADICLKRRGRDVSTISVCTRVCHCQHRYESSRSSASSSNSKEKNRKHLRERSKQDDRLFSSQTQRWKKGSKDRRMKERDPTLSKPHQIAFPFP